MERQAAVPSTGLSSLSRWGIALGLIGLSDSIYLVGIKIFPGALFCTNAGGCEKVNSSPYSEIHGIPIAVFGALAYAAILALLIFEPRLALLRERGPLFVFGLTFTGTLYSAYLTYIELEVLHSVCPYCATSAIVMTALCLISAVRLARHLNT